MTHAAPEQERFRLAKLGEVRMLEARLAKVEAETLALRRALAVARSQLQSIPTSRHVEEDEQPYPGLGNKSIIDRVRDHFKAHPDIDFSPAEVMTAAGIPVGNVEAVRKAFYKLTNRDGAIVKLAHSRYRLNEPPKDHPTQSNPVNCG